MSYGELLQTDDWKAFRWRIIWERRATCEECGFYTEDTSQLNVHHRYYRAGALPWQYQQDEIALLCRRCHEEVTDELERAYRVIGKLRLVDLPEITRFAKDLLATEPARRRLEEQTAAERGEE